MRRTLSAALEEAAESVGRTDAHVIAAHLLGVDRAYLLTHPMRVLSETEDARLDALVALRAVGQPVAYLLRKREFYGRDFVVGPEVLIPRPETEVLVEAALARLPPGGSVLDLGTGSGAVAVTLACERPDLAVTATEASAQASRLAEANAAALGASGRVRFVQGSWYAALEGERFDLVVANPPYVAAGDPHLSRGDLRFEPLAALTDGSPDGLESIRRIVEGAPARLNPGGWLLLEHGYDQGDALAALLERAGFDERLALADLAGLPRVAGGKWGQSPISRRADLIEFFPSPKNGDCP